MIPTTARRTLLAIAAAACTATAQAGECPFPGQQPMLVAQLFFGQDIAGHGRIAPRAWREFLRSDVSKTRRFHGFTVYDAYGQWLDPQTRRLGREPSKVVEIAAADSPALESAITALIARYRTRFRQQAVRPRHAARLRGVLGDGIFQLVVDGLDDQAGHAETIRRMSPALQTNSGTLPR